MRPSCFAASATIRVDRRLVGHVGDHRDRLAAVALDLAHDLRRPPRLFERTLTTTAAPPAASASAIARPMLRPAPVTSATRPDEFFLAHSPRNSFQSRSRPSIKRPGTASQRRLRLRLVPAAVAAVERELVLDVGARQRLLRAAAEMRLALLDHAAVGERRADMAGELVRIGIVRIDRDSAPSPASASTRGSLHRLVGEIAEARRCRAPSRPRCSRAARTFPA